MTGADVQEWLQSLSRDSISLSKCCFEKWCQEITCRYSEAWRHYHTLEHLADMMTHLNRWQQHVKDHAAVTLAILFHDIVYCPKSSTNEQDSVRLFQEFAADTGLNAVLVDKVVHLITATITHLPDDPSQADSDLLFFLDFDMAILGQPAEEYDRYAANIRKEYCHYDSQSYSNGRKRVLQTFLERKNIYATTEFRDQYETRARQNIQREIQQLSSQ